MRTLLRVIVVNAVALAICLTLPFFMLWAYSQRTSGNEHGAVNLIRVSSIFFLPLAAYLWVLLGSLLLTRRTASWRALLLAFGGTVAVEVLLLRIGVWL